MSVLFIIVLITILLLLPPVQTFLANKAAGYLQTEFNIKASIGGLRIKLPNRVQLADVYIEDDHSDTLIYAQNLEVTYSGFNSQENMVMSSRVKLQNGRLYMRKYPQDSLFNFAYFLQKFSTGEPDTSASSPFRLKIANIAITDFRFTKHRLGCTDTCTNIFLTDANVILSNFFLDDSYISGDVRHMSFKDADRFDLIDFKGSAAYQEKFMAVTDLYFKTTGSEVLGNATLEYSSSDDFNDFLDLVGINGNFENAQFSSDEFISYIPEFPDFDTFTLTGDFKGTVNSFDVTNCSINLGQETTFKGDIGIDNPTESDKLKMRARVAELQSTPSEFRKYITQFTGEMEWMDFLDQFKSFGFAGIYKGTIKDFDVDGNFTFDQSNLSINAHMFDFDNMDKTTYAGKISSEGVNIGKLIKSESIGVVKFAAEIDGVGLSPERLKTKVVGDIYFIDLDGYRYQNLNIDGNVENRLFDGKLSVKDPNLGLEFAGKVDFKTDTIVSDFRAHIIDANLRELKYSNSETSILNLTADIDFKIFENTWWDGEMNIFDITYSSPYRFYFFDSVQVVSTNNNQVHNDKIASKLLSAELRGNYKVVDVFDAFYAEYLDFNRFDLKSVERPMADFEFDINLFNTELLTDIFVPGLYVEPGSILKGEYKGQQKEFSMAFRSEVLRWQKLNFDDININVNHIDTTFNFQGKLKTFSYGKQIIDSINIVSNLQDDSIWFATRGIYRDSIDSYFRLDGYAFEIGTPANEEYTIKLAHGRFNIGNNYFDVIPDNLVHIKEGEIEFRNVGFYNKQSAISLQGFKSTDPNKVLRIVANNLDADLLNYLVRNNSLDFKGKMSGDVIISYESEVPKFASDFEVDSLWLNDDYIGHVFLESNWDIKTSQVAIDAEIKRKDLSIFTAKGTYFPDSAGRLDFNLNFNRFRLMWIDPFVDGILENVRGTLSGDVKVSGTFKDIQTEGELTLNQVALGVPYFATDYGLEGKPIIKISHNKIVLPKTQIRDTKEATTADLEATVTHTNFSNWALDLKVDTKNLLVLNTQNSPDAYFYGKGYAAGEFKLKGPLEDLSIDIDITTNKGTDFKLPLSNPVNVGTQSFITYTGSNNKQYIVLNPDEIGERVSKPVGGLDISIKAVITPDAAIELVMDETVGDIIKGRGQGELRIEIPHDGDMQMFGSVEITSGDYLFTMRNIINKKFTVIPGGTITWRGDPYEAIVDMKAKYTTRTTLTGMVYNNYDGQRVQVDLIMDLKGIVTNPNINFKILLPTSNASYQEELNNRLSDPDKLNVQAFSLLVINAFWTESLAESGILEQGAASNTMQMAFAQFSNWIGQGFGDIIDINVGYNTASNNNMNNEIEVDVSKTLLDDRITINSKIDVPTGTSQAGSNAQSFAGDVEIIYKITRDGKIRAKAFNRNNQDNPTLDNLSPYTQGVGIFYQINFNTYGDLWRKAFGRKPENEDPTN